MEKEAAVQDRVYKVYDEIRCVTFSLTHIMHDVRHAALNSFFLYFFFSYVFAFVFSVCMCVRACMRATSPSLSFTYVPYRAPLVSSPFFFPGFFLSLPHFLGVTLSIIVSA